MKNQLMTLSLLAVITLMGSCKKDDDKAETPSPAPAPSLYTRLGGIEAITAVTDQFLANVVADAEINDSFAATVADPYRTQLLRFNLIDQICATSGGPCQYKGLSMMEAHAGMNITETEFNALVGDLIAAMNTLSVPATEQNELLSILGSLQPQIVGQ